MTHRRSLVRLAVPNYVALLSGVITAMIDVAWVARLGPGPVAAIALAITSAWMGKPLGRNVVAIGELGLSGELRRVRDVGVRLAEAGRMGFRSALIPAEAAHTAGNSRVLDGMRVVDVDNIARALTLLGLERSEGSRGNLI